MDTTPSSKAPNYWTCAGFVASLIVAVFAATFAPPTPAHADSGEDSRFLEMVNAERRAKGVAPLVLDEQMSAPARAWTSHMASTNDLAHNPLLKNQVPSGWTRLGENVGYAGSLDGVHRALVNSPAHYANIVESAYNRIGLGIVTSGSRVWVTQTFAAASWPVTATVSNPSPNAAGWYHMTTADGRVFTFGGRSSLGSVPAGDVVDVAPTASGSGAWLATASGGVYSLGDARFFGSAAGTALAQPIVAIAARPQGDGYWLIARDGGVFAYGAARFFGSTGSIRLNQPIVGAAVSKSGNGYRFVASDGGIFAFGDAAFHGSTGAMRLNRPIVGMAATPTGSGYWLVGEDGGIFAFGDAPFLGSTGAIRLNQPIVGVGDTGTGRGYRFVAADGGVFCFGDATFLGSAGGIPFGSRVTGMTSGR